jgi:uncharacterized protein YfiM (DUF2279 family)
MAFLLSVTTVVATGQPAPPSGGSTDSLTAAAIAVELRYGAPPPPEPPLPRDRWLGRDKVKHVVFSGLWTLSTQYVLVRKADWTEADALPVSVASGATIGILKELYDASRLTGRASGKDLVANAVGIGLAVGVIAL